MLVYDGHPNSLRIQGSFVEMAANQNNVLTVHLGMFGYIWHRSRDNKPRQGDIENKQ